MIKTLKQSSRKENSLSINQFPSFQKLLSQLIAADSTALKWCRNLVFFSGEAVHFVKSCRFNNGKALSDRIKSEKEISQVNFKTLIFKHYYQKFAWNCHLEVKSLDWKFVVWDPVSTRNLINLKIFLVTKVVFLDFSEFSGIIPTCWSWIQAKLSFLPWLP